MSFWWQFDSKGHQILWKPMDHFLVHAMDILWLELLCNPWHVWAYAKQIKPVQMTWNSHGIWCQFGPNCRRFVTWNYTEFPRESVSHVLQRHISQIIMAKDTLVIRFARDQSSFRVIWFIYRKPQIFRVFAG